MLHAGRWSADGVAVRPTEVETGIFDNKPNVAEELWGLYVSRAVPSLRTNADLYYLGYDHKSVRYAQGTGREQRETIGARVWSHTLTWDYDFEYTAQFGRFNTGNISAWGSGYHLGYTFDHARFAPHPELDGGVLGGDHNAHDNTLGTFNPLFPNGNFLSLQHRRYSHASTRKFDRTIYRHADSAGDRLRIQPASQRLACLRAFLRR